MQWYKNEKYWLIAGAVVIACGIGALIVKNVAVYENGASVSIIGGADGPTSIFLAGKLSEKNPGTDVETEDGISDMPLEMTMEAVKFEKGILTLEIDNHSGYEMSYGDDYELQKRVGDTFVKIEPKEAVAWNDIAHSIPDLTKETVTCDLRPYGKLQAGEYKLVKSEMEAVFELTEDYDPE